MPSGPGERYDFFLSRRGSVAPIAREVTDVLKEQGYNVFVQDYDIRFGNSLVEKMHIGIKNSRDLIGALRKQAHSAVTQESRYMLILAMLLLALAIGLASSRTCAAEAESVPIQDLNKGDPNKGCAGENSYLRNGTCWQRVITDPRFKS
jgi:TIR domain